MSGLNKVILIGNLGKEPEYRTLDGGAVVVSFPLATTEHWKDKDGNKQESTEWSNIVAWRGIAENMNKLLTKGSLVYIEGKLRTRTYEKDEVKKYITEVVAESFILLKGGKERE